jgi:hypothetical protein
MGKRAFAPRKVLNILLSQVSRIHAGNHCVQIVFRELVRVQNIGTLPFEDGEGYQRYTLQLHPALTLAVDSATNAETEVASLPEMS